jgi:hypothetical protein
MRRIGFRINTSGLTAKTAAKLLIGLANANTVHTGFIDAANTLRNTA